MSNVNPSFYRDKTFFREKRQVPSTQALSHRNHSLHNNPQKQSKHHFLWTYGCFPWMVVPPNLHPKMIIFSRENPMGLLGKPTILGNPHPSSKLDHPLQLARLYFKFRQFVTGKVLHQKFFGSIQKACFFCLFGSFVKWPLFKFRHPIPGSPQKHHCFRLECSPPRRGWHDPVASPIHPSSVGCHGPGERWPSPKRLMMDGSLWILNEMDGEFVINFVKSKSRSKVRSISNCYQLFPSTKDSIDFFFRRAKSVASHLFWDQTRTYDRNTPPSWITRRNNSFVIAWVSKTSLGMTVPAIHPKLKAKLDLAKFKTTFGFLKPENKNQSFLYSKR